MRCCCYSRHFSFPQTKRKVFSLFLLSRFSFRTNKKKNFWQINFIFQFLCDVVAHNFDNFGFAAAVTLPFAAPLFGHFLLSMPRVCRTTFFFFAFSIIYFVIIFYEKENQVAYKCRNSIIINALLASTYSWDSSFARRVNVFIAGNINDYELLKKRKRKWKFQSLLFIDVKFVKP